jgi:hypothetical protein
MISICQGHGPREYRQNREIMMSALRAFFLGINNDGIQPICGPRPHPAVLVCCHGLSSCSDCPSLDSASSSSPISSNAAVGSESFQVGILFSLGALCGLGFPLFAKGSAWFAAVLDCALTAKTED